MIPKGKLFEYALIHHPAPIRAKEGEPQRNPKSVLISGVKQVVAVDEKEVGMLAARELPTEFLDKIDEVEVVIRPF